MKPLLSLLLLFFNFVSTQVRADVQECFNDFCLSKFATFNGREYPLTGSGLFRYWGFKVYVMGLYSLPIDATRKNILNPVPKRLVLHYLREFSIEDFQKSQRSILDWNPEINRKLLEEKLLEMDKLYLAVKKGDEYTVTFTPKIGTELAHNGRKLGSVTGNDFQKAYFGLWLSDHSINKSLRNEILKQ